MWYRRKVQNFVDLKLVQRLCSFQTMKYHSYCNSYTENRFSLPQQITEEYVASHGGCESCHESCLSCTGGGESDCLHCAQPYHLKESRCVLDCGQGYFEDQGRCLSCPSSCLDCTSPAMCNQCAPRFHLHNNQCVAACPPG